MVDVPPEIWHYIARFVPDEQLCHLLGVNSVFFDIGMDIRWKEVSIVTRNTVPAMHILERLADPFVAKRLQRLILRLTHVKCIHPGSQENASDFARLRQQFQLTVNRVFKIFRRDAHNLHANAYAIAIGGGTSSPTLKRPPRPTFSNVIDAIIDVTPHFTNVRELTIDSWDLPPAYDLKALITSFWASFGANLRSLSLGGNLEGYRVLIQSKPRLEKLRELRVEFTNNIFRMDHQEDRAILNDVVAPFIISLSGHLTALRVWSWAGALDLSVFFRRISTFPVLEYLNVRMAFDEALRDPGGLKDLLCTSSSTLQKLELRLAPKGLPMDPAREEPLGLWLAQCVADERCFAHLTALDIFPTNLPAGIDTLLQCIHRAAKTLTQLTVRDRYLQYAELALVVDAAAGCEGMRYLKLNVWRLDIALLDLLSLKLPELHQVWLSVGEALNHNEHGDLEHFFFRDLEQRRVEHSYDRWRLKDISIWQGGQQVDDDTMTALARCIPSVNSFFENGHMHLDAS